MKKFKKLAEQIKVRDIISGVAGKHTYIVTDVQHQGNNISFTLLDEYNNYTEHDTIEDHPNQQYEVIEE
jgi:uncharacterized protein (DUF4213/DUF364 family)